MLTRRRRATGDEGSIMVLIIGYTAIAAVLITVGIDTSKVFLAQRALASAADSAALAAAQGVDRQAIYAGAGLRCGEPLPLDQQHAADLAAGSVNDDATDLSHTFATVAAPETSLDAGTVSVALSGEVAVPFGRVLGWLDPSRPDGLVQVTETSHARSPVAGGTC
jgi:uncharacterized membrane protein